MKINTHKIEADDIVIDEVDKNSGTFPEGLPDTIVIHYTAGPSLSSAVHTFKDPRVKACAHIVVDRDGKITQMIPFNKIGWHAGESSWLDRNELNNYSIGIEIVNAGRMEKSGNTWRPWFGKSYSEDEVILAKHRNEDEKTWWNVENLFDVEDSPQRPDYLKSRLKSELKGWNSNVLEKKLHQLSSIIRKMNNGLGPDVVGLCEVENKPVLDKLVEKLSPLNRNYGVAHHDTSDHRGIDIAFIYDSDLFTAEEQFHYEVLKRSATRDLFQVNMRTEQGREFILIGNHWPARGGGVYETEPYRIIAAETLSYWMERIFEIRGNKIPVYIMGDFNDECYNRSMVEYALSTNSEVKVRYSIIPRLYNMMWKTYAEQAGSYYYNNFPLTLDQFLVSKGGILKSSKLRPGQFPNGEKIRIEMFPEMVSGGRYPNPVRFGRPSTPSSFNPETGYSDHYPISMIMSEK